jgi:hypothetical protein
MTTITQEDYELMVTKKQAGDNIESDDNSSWLIIISVATHIEWINPQESTPYLDVKFCGCFRILFYQTHSS